MKAFNLLLFAIVFIRGFVIAGPLPVELGEESATTLLTIRVTGSNNGGSSGSSGSTTPIAEKEPATKKRPANEPAENQPAAKKPAAENDVASGKIPPFKTISLAAKATSYHFYTSREYLEDPLVKGKQHFNVLEKMDPAGQFTAVVMYNAKTSIVGDADGTTTPDKYVLSKSNGAENFLVTNGGYFIHKIDPLLMDDWNGKPLDAKTVLHQSVGQTSISKKFVAVPKVYADLYTKLEGDDKSFLWSGPDLKRPIDEKIPVDEDINSKAWRLQYFKKDSKGKKVKNPDEKSKDKLLTTPFTHLPGGGICTSNEPNERNALVYVDGIKIAFAYTSERQNGMTINRLRELIDQFLKTYLKKDISKCELALNLDGGGSIFFGWVNKGKLSVLAAGELGGPRAIPFAPGEHKFRDVTTMVKHVLA